MAFARTVLVFTVALCLLYLMGDVSNSVADLHGSISRYKNSRVNPDSIAKLARYDHLIVYFSGFAFYNSEHTVSPDFVRALILAESGVEPEAESEDHAIGLGQILLTTGIEAGRELSSLEKNFHYVSRKTLKDITKKDLKDPAVNILITCYLIAKYNHKFSGRLDLVVSAWNAGENTASLKQGKHAPYKETENLIARVNSYYVYLLKHNTFR